MNVHNGGDASGRLERMKGVAATIATMVSSRQRLLEQHLHLLPKVVVPENVAGASALSDGIERFRFQRVIEQGAIG